MSEALREFNRTVFDLLTDMKTCLPSSRELGLAHVLYGSMVKASPGNPVVLDMYWKFASEHKEAILNKDWDLIRQALSTLCPQPEIVDSIWNSLSHENREVVAEYVQQLYDQAASIKGADTDNVESGTTESGQNPSPAICHVYNKMWVDLLTDIVQSSPQDQAVIQSLGKMQEFLDKTSKRRVDGVYRIFHPLLSGVLPTEPDETALLGMLQPPTDIEASMDVDVGLLSGVAFPFHRDTSMGHILTSIKSAPMPAKRRLSIYWHYIKVMTCVMAQCPPEVMQVMNGFLSSV